MKYRANWKNWKTQLGEQAGFTIYDDRTIGN